MCKGLGVVPSPPTIDICLERIYAMGRTSLKAKNGNTIVYGYDNPMCTYFYQEFDAEGECVVDKGDIFEPLSHGQLLQLLHENAVMPEDEQGKDKIRSVALDLSV